MPSNRSGADTTDIWGQTVLCWRAVLCPSDVRQHPWHLCTKCQSLHLPTPVMTTKQCLQALPDAPRVAKSPQLRITGLGERNAFTLLCRRVAELSIIFSIKDQIVNNFGFPGHMIFLSATEFCPYRMKEATNNR